MSKRLAAEQDMLEQVKAQTGALAQTALSNLDEAKREADLVEQIVLPQSRSTYENMLSAYISAGASFIDLLDAERNLLRARLEQHDARRVLDQAILNLARVRGTLQ